MKSRRQQSRDEQRRRMLDAARFLFGAHSFDDVTMADVAARAGVARATLFNHFPSKHDLIEAITDEVIAYWAAMLEQALADEATPTPALVRALFAPMGAGIEHFYRFYRGIFREIARVQVGLEEGSGAARTSALARERLVRLLARGQERGEIRADAAAIDLAAAFDHVANGTIGEWLFDDPSGSLRERMERMAEVYLGPVAIGPAADRTAARDQATFAPPPRPSSSGRQAKGAAATRMRRRR